MKKNLISLISILMIIGLFISCSNEMQGEPLAYVSFGDNSRAIESTNESLPVVNDLLWKYTAVKKDKGLKTGQTSDTPINIKDGNTPGLSNTQVGPFSIGSWEFTLFGYTKESDSSETYNKLVYKGTKIVSLSVNTTTTVSVDIQYAGNETQGTLKLDDLILTDSKGNNVSGGAKEAKLVLNGNRKDGNSTSTVSFEYEIGEGRTFNSEGDSIEAGIWQFTFTFKDVNENIVSNIQSRYILIMGGKTTTLSGDVREYEQKAQFEANHYYQQYNDSFWVIGNTEVALNATKDAAQKYSEDNSVPAYVYLNGDIETSNPIEFSDGSSVASRAISASVVKPSKVILNLNGKLISYQNNTNPEAAIIINNPGLTLVITDNSEIQTTGISSNNNCFDVIKGSLIIEGGKHSSSATVINIESDASVVISENAEIAVGSVDTVAIKNSGNLLMEGGKISGSTAIQITNKDASTIIKSGELDVDTTVSNGTSEEIDKVFISKDVDIKEGASSPSSINVNTKVGTGTQEDPFLVFDKITFDKALSLIASNTSNNYIKLIKSFTVNETIKVSNGIVLDLNGYSIHGNKVRTFQFIQETSTITGAGTISSDVENVGSSVIRVGDNNASNNVELIINKDVSITTDTAYGVTLFGNKNESLTVYGIVKSNAPKNKDFDGCAISTLGDDYSLSTRATVNIYDGAQIFAKNSNGIYMPSGLLNIYGGDISGLTGIYIKAGTTKISGGRIIGTGTKENYTYYGNGGVSTGDAFVVDNCGYPGGIPSPKVTGGYFESNFASSIASYVTGENRTKKESFISGGIFNNEPDSGLFDATHKALFSEEENLWITHTHNVKSIVDDKYLITAATCTNKAKYYKSCQSCGDAIKGDSYTFISGENLGGHIVDFDTNDNFCKRCSTFVDILIKNKTTGKTTAPDSFSKFTSSCSVKLMNDVQINRFSIQSNNNINIDFDLNGHTLSINNQIGYPAIYFYNTTNSSFKIYNGKIKEIAQSKKDIIFANITNGANKYILGSNLNIECIGTTTAVLVENGLNLDSEANITTVNAPAIQTNGSTTTDDSIINITNGNIISNGVAIYLPGGKLNITGGKIEGSTAVYVKSDINVSGGELIGTGNAMDYNFNGDGCNSTGDALVIDSCNYPSGVPVVNIIGGKFISENNKPVGSYCGNGVTEKVKGFISGGSFSSDPSSYYDFSLLKEGYQTKNTDNLWIVSQQ